MSQTGDGFRVDDYVLLRLLKPLVESNREFRKTELSMKARVNYDTLQRYLPMMKKAKLVNVWRTEDGTQLIKITKIGIQAYTELSRWKHAHEQIQDSNELETEAPPENENPRTVSRRR